METTCKLRLTDNGFELRLPESFKGEELFGLLKGGLDEVTPGFGQLGISDVWAKLAHWPTIEEEDQKEGVALTLFFR